MFGYCKRNKYIKKLKIGRSNKGVITIRGRQKVGFNLSRLKNINYNYMSLRHLEIYIKKSIIKLKIINEVLDCRNQRNIYIAAFLNSPLKDQYKYFPKTYGLKIGDNIYIGNLNLICAGSILSISNLTCGSWIHNIESIRLKGSVFVKRSKVSALVLSLGDKYSMIKLPSGSIRLIEKNVFCIYGKLNTSIVLNKKKKAGDSRYLGRRPKVRGVAMNSCDHPHGGGEGKGSIGRSSIYSPWGSLPKGKKTRLKKKYSNKLIIKNKC